MAEVVMSCSGPLEYVPMAVNCCVVPMSMVGSTGVTAIESNFGATVIVDVPETVPNVVTNVAVTVVEPAARAVA